MKRNIVTIHDIARQLKVSPSTVSRALNDNPRISINTRRAVKDLAEKNGYHPNVIASYLRKGENRTVGVIVPRINRFFFSNVIGGIEEILTPAGYTLTICQSHELFEKELLNLTILNNLRVDGIILSLAAETFTTDHVKELVGKGLNIVMFDRINEDLDVSSVKVDDFEGSYQVVSHLLDQGYTNIAHFSGPKHLNVYRDRMNGYIKALEDRGISIQENLIISDCLTKEKGIEACRNILSLSGKPDAIFAASDFSAIGAMITSRSMGLQIPSELGIAGFANEPFTEFVTPSLTTVDQNSVEMGRMTARVFLNSIKNPDDHITPEKIIIKPEVIVRASSLRNKLFINFKKN